MGKGQSLFDRKIDALSKLDTSFNAEKLPKKCEDDDVPQIVQTQNSTEALDFIDEIHDKQQKKLELGLPKLYDSLDKWSKSNKDPCYMDTIMSLAIIDARNEKQRKDNQLTEDDFFTNIDALKSLEKIKRRYNIEIDDDFLNSDQ